MILLKYGNVSFTAAAFRPNTKLNGLNTSLCCLLVSAFNSIQYGQHTQSTCAATQCLQKMKHQNTWCCHTVVNTPLILCPVLPPSVETVQSLTKCYAKLPSSGVNHKPLFICAATWWCTSGNSAHPCRQCCHLVLAVVLHENPLPDCAVTCISNHSLLHKAQDNYAPPWPSDLFNHK